MTRGNEPSTLPGRPKAEPAERPVYAAFISHSSSDADLANQLRDGLHRFAKHWYQARAIRVFLDKTGLTAGASLWVS